MSHFEKYLSNAYQLQVTQQQGDSVIAGKLVAKNPAAKLPEALIVNAIPRFVAGAGYVDNFGVQWNMFRSTQLDSYTGKNLTAERFWTNTKWTPALLAGKTILEVGSGAGRFTEILLAAGAQVVSFDYSTAVDANFKNNQHRGDLFLFQGDIFNLPVPDEYFDFVFCYGVLQHTPDPAQAFANIARKLKPGGQISVDVYWKDGKISPWKSKYLWRPITTRISPAVLLRWLQFFIPLWFPFDTVLKRIPFFGNYLGALIPCWNYLDLPLPWKDKVQWAIMDTFDALAPQYDLPATKDELQSWFAQNGYTSFEVFPGSNGLVGNTTKPMRQ